MGQTVGPCRLCLEQRELIDAHIIPKAFWPLDEATPKLLSNTSGTYPSRAPQGVYDSDILCEKCDTNVLGVLDQHAAEELLRGQSELLHTGLRQYPTADPIKIHQFVASVAWRASISSHKFFKRIGLGRYEDVIRKMILGRPTEQACVQVAIAEFDNHQGMLDPHQTRFDGIRFSLIYAERFVFYVKTDRKPCPSFLVEGILDPQKAVVTIPRNWHQAKEKRLLQKIAQLNPKAFPRQV
jgi:hypothetical protein